MEGKFRLGTGSGYFKRMCFKPSLVFGLSGFGWLYRKEILCLAGFTNQGLGLAC